MKALSFYELSTELAPLESALEASGGEVTDDALVEKVSELLTATQAKVDAYGRFARSLESTIKAIREEEIRLKERRQAFENRLSRLKEAAKKAMEIRGIVKVEGDIHTINIQRNGGRPSLKILVVPESLPEEYQRIVKEPDLEKLREAIEAGDKEAMKLAELGDVGYSVRIR